MKHKLSQWHSADTKPAHSGVYQVKCKFFADNIEYSYFNGIAWSPQRSSIDKAEFSYQIEAAEQGKQWRGVVK